MFNELGVVVARLRVWDTGLLILSVGRPLQWT
jgi:hypothetical protein